MDSKIQNRIVRIEARFGHCDPKFGTGFRLKSGLVLTSQHVLQDRLSTGDVLKAKEIFVSLDPDGSGENILREECKVLWRGEASLDLDGPRALDAALLEDSLPTDDLEPFLHLIPSHLPEGGRYETAGYVGTSASSQELHAPDGFPGSFDPAKEQSVCIQLISDRDPPRAEHPIDREQQQEDDPKLPKNDKLAWGGISGASIFVADGPHKGWLYGVIRRRVYGLPDGLYAVSTTALLQDPEFRRHVGIPDPSSPSVQLLAELKKLLDENRGLSERVAAMDPAWRASWDARAAEGLLEVLRDLNSLLKQLKVLAEDLSKPADLAALREIVAYLVAALALYEVRAGDVEEASPGYFKLAFASPNFAEAAIAAREGRRTLYKKSQNPQASAGRELELPVSQLESGLRKEAWRADQIRELSACFIEDDLSVKPYLTEEYRQMFAGLSQDIRIRELASVINRRLVGIAGEKKGKPYLLLTPGRKTLFAQSLHEFLSKLRELLPNLVYLDLNLSEDVSRSAELEEKLEPLWRILGFEEKTS